jgi:hypothetical protein
MATEYLNNKDFEKIIFDFQKLKRDLDRLRMIMEDQQDAIARKSKRKANTDWNLSLLDSSTREHLTASEEYDLIKQRLATAFYVLSDNLVRYAKFHLIDADDALQEGVVICFEKVDRFVPKKGRAFNYMTTCILNHFRQLYRSARNYNELKKKYHDFQQLKLSKTIISNGKEKIVFQNNDEY